MSGSCGGSVTASPAGPSDESGSGEWRRIYDRVEALLPQVEKLASNLARLEETNKTQRENLVQAEASRRRWKAAYIELPLLANPKITELKENDLKDYRTREDDDNLQLKKASNSIELSQNNEDREGIAGELRLELRKLKQAYKTLSSNKDKEISVLLGLKDFLWNKLRTIDKENMALLKIKEVEAAQANEAAQKLQQNIEEMQVAAQNNDNEIEKLRAEAVNAKKRVLILEGKLLEMHFLVKEKNDEIQKLKNGQPESLKCKCAASVSNETSQECSEDTDEVGREEYTETSQECSSDIDNMDLEDYTIFVEIRAGKTITLDVNRSDTIYDVKAKIQDKEGISACLQRLIFKDELLVGSYTLQDYGIWDDSTLTLNLVRHGMHIFVKTNIGKTMTFEVEQADTVYSVKLKIFGETCFLPAHQGLVVAGKELAGDEHTFADYNIQNDSVLYLVLRMRDVIRVTVRTPSGFTVMDRTLRSETVGCLKAKIHAWLCIPPEQQRLSWRVRGQPLENDYVWANTESSRVKLVLQPLLPGGQ